MKQIGKVRIRNMPALRPRCPVDAHGFMEWRPSSRQTPEQLFCGVWYDCTQCKSSVLFPSPGLKAQLADMRKGGAHQPSRKRPRQKVTRQLRRADG